MLKLKLSVNLNLSIGLSMKKLSTYLSIQTPAVWTIEMSEIVELSDRMRMSTLNEWKDDLDSEWMNFWGQILSFTCEIL